MNRKKWKKRDERIELKEEGTQRSTRIHDVFKKRAMNTGQVARRSKGGSRRGAEGVALAGSAANVRAASEMGSSTGQSLTGESAVQISVYGPTSLSKVVNE